MIDKRAMAIGALAAVAFAWGTWLVETAKGHDGNPYILIFVVGFVAQMIATVVLSCRP